MLRTRSLKAGFCILASIALLPWSAAPPQSSAARLKAAAGKTSPPKAWLSANGICCFPLAANELPPTEAQLTQSMLTGWHGVLSFPAPGKVVDIFGGRYPAIDTFHVDLGNAVVNSKRKTARINDTLTPTSRSVSVANFRMAGRPLIEDGAKLNIELSATYVRLDLQKDKDGNPLLMLADADSGELRADISQDDLEKLFLLTAREQAAKHGLRVRKAEVSLKSVGPRQLSLDLHLSVIIGFVPAGMHFTSQIDIDEKMNARISNLSCEGDEVLGPLVVGLIRPALARYNNLTRPLLSLPSPTMKLKDIHIRAGERLELYARFGR